MNKAILSHECPSFLDGWDRRCYALLLLPTLGRQPLLLLLLLPTLMRLVLLLLLLLLLQSQ